MCIFYSLLQHKSSHLDFSVFVLSGRRASGQVSRSKNPSYQLMAPLLLKRLGRLSRLWAVNDGASEPPSALLFPYLCSTTPSQACAVPVFLSLCPCSGYFQPSSSICELSHIIIVWPLRVWFQVRSWATFSVVGRKALNGGGSRPYWHGIIVFIWVL